MMNADRIEIDVILSKDDKLIVCHDILIDELTNVREVFPKRAREDKRFYVFDFTYDELKKLNVTERLYNHTSYDTAYYPNRFPIWKSHFQLHSFPEGLEMIEGLHKTYKLRNSDNSIKNVSYLIEIKRPYLHELNNKTNLSDILMETLIKYGYNVPNSPIIIQSFDPYELIKIKKKYNTPIRLVQLLAPNLDAYPEEIGHVDYNYWNSREGLLNISSFAIGKLNLEIQTRKHL
jgi:glycerophosphoryl diester phosphodiesterase